MRRAFLCLAFGALLVAGAVVVVPTLDGDDGSYCLAFGYLPGMPTRTEGDVTLIVDMSAEARSEDNCFFSHLAPQDRQVSDGVLFDDCVIWWEDGRKSTAEKEAFPCG